VLHGLVSVRRRSTSIYLLRKPLTWIFIAGFIAIALSGPVHFLSAGCGAASRSRSSTSG
jgi:predicted PurR-regulated permease PerM